MQPQAFPIDISQTELDSLKQRLADTRWADDLGNSDWRYGVEKSWLQDMICYWRDDYDWNAIQKTINQFGNFKVTIEGNPIHFAHIRGKSSNPAPLLLLHGWPWTFMDFYDLIGPLTDPASYGGDPQDAFDLIIPSLPGFGFSMPLANTGIDIPKTAGLFKTLMVDILGYQQFNVAGGDFGAIIAGQMAHAYPDHVTALLASIPLFPGLDLNAITDQDHAADEQWMIQRRTESLGSITSHVAVNISDPQTLAYALVDSPVGTAAWLWERRRAWSDCDGELLNVHSRDFLCTLASIYWLTKSIGSSLRLYWEHFSSGMPIKPLYPDDQIIKVPTAYLIHPKEVMLVPRCYAEKHTNLQRWKLMERGGHFAFSEQPNAISAELTSFFSDYR